MRKQRHEISAAGACPVETALDVMGGKWKGIILFRLADRPVRFNVLRRRLCRITVRTLTRQLRERASDGLVTRTTYPEVPPRVEYALTPGGTVRRPVLDTLRQWSETCPIGPAEPSPAVLARPGPDRARPDIHHPEFPQ